MGEIKEGKQSQFLRERSKIGEIVFFAIVVALGVNLVAGGLVLVDGITGWTVFYIGLGVCLVAVVALLIRLIRKRKYVQDLEAFFVFNTKTNELVTVARYGFSEALGRYISASFTENPALLKIWKSDPLRFTQDNMLKSPENAHQDDKEREPKSFGIIREGAEYVVLDLLSMHLSDYFNKDSFMGDRLVELNREDVPAVLLKNRIFELLSRPMEDRSAFVDGTLKNRGSGEIVAASQGGHLYHRFRMVLPENSKVVRVNANTICISTKEFDMKIGLVFDGMNTNL